MTDNTFTRVDPLMVHDALLYGPHRQDAADYACAALRAAYEEMDNNDEAIQSYARTVVRMQAEIDRLRALVPVWTTYDGTPETLPPVGSKIYQISAYHHEFMGFRESETTWGEIWGGGYRLWSISVGERWAPAMYDPDPPKYRKVEEGEVKA